MHDVLPESRPCRTPSPFRTSLEELAALYAAIIGEAVPEFRRLDAAITDRLR